MRVSIGYLKNSHIVYQSSMSYDSPSTWFYYQIGISRVCFQPSTWWAPQRPTPCAATQCTATASGRATWCPRPTRGSTRRTSAATTTSSGSGGSGSGSSSWTSICSTGDHSERLLDSFKTIIIIIIGFLLNMSSPDVKAYKILKNKEDFNAIS